jgi:hypothetical protein
MELRNQEDIDLEKMIKKPEKAREFIESIDWRPELTPTVLVMGENEVIELTNMTDEQAVKVARFILLNIEIPKTQLSFEFQFLAANDLLN